MSTRLKSLNLRRESLSWKKQSPSGEKVGYERWQELHALRKSHGILTHEDNAEHDKLKWQTSEVGEKIRAELARENERARGRSNEFASASVPGLNI
jgi:hypothetical protein